MTVTFLQELWSRDMTSSPQHRGKKCLFKQFEQIWYQLKGHKKYDKMNVKTLKMKHSRDKTYFVFAKSGGINFSNLFLGIQT